MKPKRHMVRVAFVAFVLIAGLVVVEAAGAAEDKDGPRSSVLTTVVDDVRPVPVVESRKLSKNSKASQDDAVSKEVERLLRLLVLKTAVDMYRFSMQPARSLAEDETAAARVNPAVSSLVRLSTYEKYECDGCLDFFEGAPQYTTGEQKTFCSQVSDVYDLINSAFFICIQLFQCASAPSTCCQSLGGTCRN